MKQVYAIQAKNGGPIKIGTANSVAQRVKALQVGSPDVLVVVRAFNGGHAMEKALHCLLSEHRVCGEWFKDHPEVHAALTAAEKGELLHEDDWVSHAAALRDKGMSYAQLGRLYGYSREYVRQKLRPGYRQPGSCTLPSKIGVAVNMRQRGESYAAIGKEIGASHERVRQLVSEVPVTASTPENPTGIQRAIDAAGSETALGELIGCTQQYINKAKQRGWISIEKAKIIANNFPIELKALVHPRVAELL